jgi:hypothetical protein
VIIRSPDHWPAVYASLDKARKGMFEPFPKSGVEVIWRVATRDRSLEQNALSHKWYSIVSETEHEYTPGQIKSRCKYHFGLPILRGDDPDFNAWCVKVIDPLPYESRIEAMEHLDVTSLMKVPQMSRYLEQVQAHYAGRVDLRFPDENQA